MNSNKNKCHFPRPRLAAIALLLLLCATLAGAMDAGVILEEKFEALANNGNTAGIADGTADVTPAWTQTASPWLSYAHNEQLSFLFSIDLTLEFSPQEHTTTVTPSYSGWRPLFQVNRFQTMWRPLPGLLLQAGRVPFHDPLAHIASGLFDGLTASLNRDRNSLDAALLFTGLQYKERAKVVMTEGDLQDYLDKDLYFAANRLLVSTFWQSRSLGGWDNALDAGALAQVDMRGGDGEKLHSQYLLGKFRFPVLTLIDITAGGIFGIKEQDSGSALSFMGSLDVGYALPGAVTDRLTVGGLFSSGVADRYVRPYFPVSAIAEGEVYTPTPSGLYTVKLMYEANLVDTLYVNAAGRYFWRSTRDIIPGSAKTGASEEDQLGLELYGSTVWAPLSDLSFKVGGGVFFPDGPLKEVDTPVMWKLEVTATVSL
ncbi:MAG: hypothetical protein LBT39_07410 [Treponema sp.]|jgi:hypothetical protein|nr:hypothetical protein [Treponema sp.]